MLRRLVGRVRDLEGHTLTDFALVLALITVVGAGALTLCGAGFDETVAFLASLF